MFSVWISQTYETHPTPQTAPLSLIAFATAKESLISSTGPVATGFSTNNGTPGKCFNTCISISFPSFTPPRNVGGEPITTARGFSCSARVSTNSCKVAQMRVFWYAPTRPGEEDSRLALRTPAARSVAGSITATMRRRGPSFLE